MLKSHTIFLLILFALSLSAFRTDVLAKENSDIAKYQITEIEKLDLENGYIYLLDKKLPKPEELEKIMPSFLTAVTEENEKIEIPVEWYCDEEQYYDDTRYSIRFEPKFEASIYNVEENCELPYFYVDVKAREEYKPSTLNLTGNGNEDTCYNFLRDSVGLNCASSCGVLGNLYIECSFNPLAYNASENAWGICQWRGGRLSNLQSRYPNSWKTLDSQLHFLVDEFNGMDYSGSKTLTYLKGRANDANGAQEAAQYFAQYFERCASSTYASRKSWAVKFYNDRIINTDPSYTDFSISKNQYKLKEKIEFFVNPINATRIGISIDKEGGGRVVGTDCNGTNGHTLWASELGVGNYSAHITVYNGIKWVDTETVYFSVIDPQPSYSDFSISQSVYSLHEKIEFKINPINSTGIGISIDKEGVGRVVAEGCNGTNGHTLWGIGLGVGNYSAHITVYNDEKWVDTDTVYFSVVPPTYSNLEINKKKVGTAEEAKFSISTSHAEFMVLKIDREGEGCVYTERCWDSLDSWSVKADTLGVGQYKAHFLVFSTNDYYIETEEITFSIYQSPERSKLSCLPGDSHTKTIFQWEKAAYTTYYDLRIDAADYETGGNIKNVWQLRENRCSVWLPAGEYAAHVDSVNEDGAVGGELIDFTVKEGEGTPVNLGEEIKTEIVTAKGSSLITNTGKEVKLESGDEENVNQIWKFTKQEDGSYVIYSEAGKGVLTAPDEAGANISVAKYQKQDNQKWKVYGDEEGYVLQSVGNGYTIGLSGKDEVILGGYTLKYSDDQMFLFKEAGVITNKPVLFLSQDDGRLTASVFNTDHVTEYGFVYGNQSDITLETPGRTRVAYSNLDSNGSYSFDATELTGCTIRAYAAYTDEDGTTQVIYSDPISR